jgi:tetratricopeptide (TPR) repeat protein
VSVTPTPTGTSRERLKLANELLDMGRVDTASELVRAVLAVDPHHGRALCTLARCHDEAGENTQTLAAAEAAIEVDPDNEWAHRLRSVALRKLGRVSEALAAADRAVELDPHWWGTHRARASALLTGGQTLEAYRSAARVRELAPTNPESYYLFTDVYEAAGELSAARREYHAGLAVSPTHVPLLGGLAYLDRLERRDGRAARRYLDVLALRPADNGYRLRLHRAVAAMERRVGALGALVAVPILATYHPGGSYPWRLALIMTILVAYGTVIGWTHRRLGRLWQAQARFNDGVTRLAAPQLAMLAPAALLTVLAVPGAWMSSGLVAVFVVYQFLVLGPAVSLLGADVGAILTRWRRRTAFRKDLRKAGITPITPP